MIRTILVAGIRSSDNSVIDLCQNHFLEVTHVPDISHTRSIPLKDAVVIVATAISTGTDRFVKELYKSNDRPIFYANNGTSNMKKDFLKAVYGNGVFDLLKNSTDIPNTTKILYFLARFAKVGERIKSKDFKAKLRKIMEKDMGSSVDNFFFNTIAKGSPIIEKVDDGIYIWKGLTRKAYEQLTENGLQLEEDPVFQDSMIKKAFAFKGAELPLLIEEPAPAPEPEIISEEETPMIEHNVSPRKEDNESVYIMLEALEKFEKRQTEALEKFEKRLAVMDQNQITRLNGYQERIGASMTDLDRILEVLVSNIRNQFAQFLELINKSIKTSDAAGAKVVSELQQLLTLHRDLGELSEHLKGMDVRGMEESVRMWKLLHQNFQLRSSSQQQLSS